MFTSGSPNGGQLQIGIALVLQDRFSNQAREASSQIRRLHQEAKNVTNANLSAVNSIATMGASAGAAALYGIGGMVKQGAKFIDTMTFVDAVAEKSGVTMAQLQDKAQSLGKETMFDSQDIASAMQFFAVSGQNTKEIYNNIAAAANLAGGTMSELGGKGGAADIMASIMKQFQIASTELNSSHVSDILVKGVTSAKTNLYDMAEAIKYAGSTVTTLGGSLEQTVAMLGVLGNAGITGSMAGTSIANAYRYLAKSIGDEKFKGHKALTSLGLDKRDFIDARGQMIDMGLAMQKISKAAQGQGNLTWFNELVDILGVRGQRAGHALIQSFGEYSDILGKLQGSQGMAQQVMTMRMGSLAGGIDKVTSSLENVITTFTTSLAPVLTPILNGISTIFDNLRNVLAIPILGSAITSFLTFGTALVTIRLGVLALKSSWRLMFNDSTVTFANMIAVMQAGWKKVTMSAEQYAAIEAGIIAQQKAGIMAPGGQVFSKHSGINYMMGMPGTYVGGYMYKNGRFYEKSGRGATGVTRVAASKVVGAIGNKSAQELGLVGAGVGTSIISAGMFKGGLSGALKGIGSIGKGLVSFLGGPWGIGLMAATTFLPMIFDAISGNTDSHNANTGAIENNTALEREKAQKESQKLSSEEQRIMIIQALNNFADAIRNNKPIANITLNVDGEEKMKQMIEASNSQQVVNLSAK